MADSLSPNAGNVFPWKNFVSRWFCFLFAGIASFAITNPAKAANITWTNAAGGNWNTSANWNVGVPTVTDNAFLNSLAGTYTVNETDTQTVNNLTINAGNAALNLTGSLTINGTFALNAGTYTLSNGTATINGSMTTGASAVASWTGGTLTGSGTLSGTLIASGGDQKYISGTALKNGGTLQWIGGKINGSGLNGTLTNLPTGVIDFTDDGEAFSADVGIGILANQGTLRKSGGSATATEVKFLVNLNDGGFLNVQTGTLNFSQGGTLSNGTTTISGSGTAALANGTFTVPAGATFTAQSSGGANLQWTGGTLTGSGTLTGTLIASGGDQKYISGTSLKNSGTLQWIGGKINGSGLNGTLTNLPTGVIDFMDDGEAFSADVAIGILANQGTLRKSGGSATATEVKFTVNLNDGGILNIQTGTLNFSQGGTLSNGTTTTSGSGTAALANGTFTVPAGATFTALGSGGANLNWTGGTLTGSGTLSGTLIASGGDQKYISGTALKNGGTLQWIGGKINGSGLNATLTNLSTGLIDLQADGAAFSIDVALGTLANQGILRKSAGSIASTTVAWNVTNGGTITALTGTLNLTGTNTNTGVVTMAAGAVIGGNITSNANGRVQGPAGGSAVYNGALTFNSGSALAPGTTTPGSEVGGITINNNLVMTAGASFEIHIKGATPVVAYDQVSVNGTIALGGATLMASLGTYTPSPSDRFFIALNDGTDAISGTFNNLPNGGTISIGTYTGTISYFGDSATNATTGGNDIVLYGFAAVPESAWLFGMASLTTACCQWFHRRPSHHSRR
jgi:hypothetical protein